MRRKDREASLLECPFSFYSLPQSQANTNVFAIRGVAYCTACSVYVSVLSEAFRIPQTYGHVITRGDELWLCGMRGQSPKLSRTMTLEEAATSAPERTETSKIPAPRVPISKLFASGLKHTALTDGLPESGKGY